MHKGFISVFILILLVVTLFSGCFEQDTSASNGQPDMSISYPVDDQVVSHIVMISGIASDPDGNETLVSVEIRIGNGTWDTADGLTQWSYTWDAYEIAEGEYTINARAWDGIDYSEIASVTVEVAVPTAVDSDVHKWAVFIAAANFPKENESKLGNGGLLLAEEMAAYLIEEAGYPTSNMVILFDDGWIRSDNGYGNRIETLQERPHKYDITYGGATKSGVITTLNRVIDESNKYRDSEVFIWVFNHGYGDENNTITGGKLLSSSWIFLWDDALRDKELGDLLGPLKSSKVCIIVDACYCGGFADKTIFNIPSTLLLRSGIPQPGRIVITGSSKFRRGFTSTTQGPLFSQLWFEGIQTGNADGYKAGLLKLGRPTRFRFFKDGETSVEEAFYYARYILRTDESLSEFSVMEPQINDRYPRRGFLLSRREMILGQV